MDNESFLSSVKEDLKGAYNALFQNEWPTWLAGILMAIMALLIFLWQGPWGIAGGYKNWGQWFYYLVGVSNTAPDTTPLTNTMSLTNIGLLSGALISALISKQFAIRGTSGREYTKGLLGGMLMGTGAALAGGCNVGGFYTAIGMFSMGGYAMMIGLGVGANLGLRVLLWEMDHLPVKPSPPKPPKTPPMDWSKIQPYLGGLLMIGIIGAFYFYDALDKTQLGGLLFFGFLIGIIMHRSRFCFSRAFRCPFMTGESEMVKAVSISLIVYGIGSAVIKWNYLQPDMMGVYHPFWIGSLLGGTIFGIGMLLAGGCASSTLWRVGEGHTKLMVTLVAFALTNPMVSLLLNTSGLEPKLGTGTFLPKVITWYFTPPVFLLILIVWILWARWNEKHDKCVLV
ncbi:MAG: YeeE/YedE family protein [Proteobacteria bacterium]|nr:YeeE/YedE family protein [Pseudomonadota bacterium]